MWRSFSLQVALSVSQKLCGWLNLSRCLSNLVLRCLKTGSIVAIKKVRFSYLNDGGHSKLMPCRNCSMQCSEKAPSAVLLKWGWMCFHLNIIRKTRLNGSKRIAFRPSTGRR